MVDRAGGRRDHGRVPLLPLVVAVNADGVESLFEVADVVIKDKFGFLGGRLSGGKFSTWLFFTFASFSDGIWKTAARPSKYRVVPKRCCQVVRKGPTTASPGRPCQVGA